MRLRGVLRLLPLLLIFSPFIVFQHHNFIQRSERGEIKIDGHKWGYRIFNYDGSFLELKKEVEKDSLVFEGRDYLAFFRDGRFYLVYGGENPTVVELKFEGEEDGSGLVLSSDRFGLRGDGSSLTLSTDEFEIRNRGGKVEFEKR